MKRLVVMIVAFHFFLKDFILTATPRCFRSDSASRCATSHGVGGAGHPWVGGEEVGGSRPGVGAVSLADTARSRAARWLPAC